MALKLITPPAAEGVATLDDLKAHLRLDSDDFDDELQLKLAAAVSHVEELTRRALSTQTWQLNLSRFPAGDRPISLPRGSLQSVTITYLDADGDRVTLDEDDYAVSTFAEPGQIVPAWLLSWPEHREFLDSVQIEFDCGYGDDPEDVPADLRAAVLLFAGWLWEGTENDIALGGTQTARSRAFLALWRKYLLESDEVAELIAS